MTAWKDNAADVVNIKIGKFGGLTKAKRALDFCTEVGLAMTIEDTWGGERPSKAYFGRSLNKVCCWSLT